MCDICKNPNCAGVMDAITDLFQELFLHNAQSGVRLAIEEAQSLGKGIDNQEAISAAASTGMFEVALAGMMASFGSERTIAALENTIAYIKAAPRAKPRLAAPHNELAIVRSRRALEAAQGESAQKAGVN